MTRAPAAATLRDSVPSEDGLSERIESLSHDLQVHFARHRHDAAVTAQQSAYFATYRAVCGDEPDDFTLLSFLTVQHCKVFGHSNKVYEQAVSA